MPSPRAKRMPAPLRATQPASRAARKPPSDLAIGLILASVLLLPLRAQDPPADLLRLVAHRESETEAERNQYLYRQTVMLEELDGRGTARGDYREIRDI